MDFEPERREEEVEGRKQQGDHVAVDAPAGRLRRPDLAVISASAIQSSVGIREGGREG